MYYMFRPTAAIVRVTELLHSIITHFLSALPPYTGQCLHFGNAFNGYFVYILPLCYKIY
jgi:hypothetical protein